MINQAGMNLIKKYESCRLAAYPDPVFGTKKWTIGYGQTKGIKGGMNWTQQQAEQDLINTTNELSDKITALCKLIGIELAENQLAALTAFAYNCGFLNLMVLVGKTFQTPLKGKKVADKMLEFDHADGKEVPGLLARRLAEGTLFLIS